MGLFDNFEISRVKYIKNKWLGVTNHLFISILFEISISVPDIEVQLYLNIIGVFRELTGQQGCLLKKKFIYYLMVNVHVHILPVTFFHQKLNVILI